MTATRAAAPQANWLMLFGALCMLVGSLLPITSSSLGALSATHRHLTLDGIVPAHTHHYDTASHGGAATTSCVVTDTSSVGPNGSAPHSEALVCAPEGTDAQAVASIVIHVPSLEGLHATGIESVETLGPDLAWQDALVPLRTPPPRS